MRIRVSPPAILRSIRCALGIVAIFLLAWILRGFYDAQDNRRATDSQSSSQPTLSAVTSSTDMSQGYKSLMLHGGNYVSMDDPRVQQTDSLIAALADRFQVPAQDVADMAVRAGAIVKEKYPEEELLDVLDAPLVATLGASHDDLPHLSVLLALYATSRTAGNPPRSAKRMLHALLDLKRSRTKNHPHNVSED